ncbi:MAG: hypothetical protein ACP6IS_05990 [Candidatus Asgardarchaeia archaeon]
MTKILFENPNESELVLVEKRKVHEIRCGKCGGDLWVYVYYTPDGRYLKKIYCKVCNYAIWTE